MAWTNYHSHCHLCDGSHAPEAYVRSAVDHGMDVYGFSSHAPMPYAITLMRPDDLPVYVDEVNRLKRMYAGQIEILLGLEIDYLPEAMGPGDSFYADLGLDYTIGSIHYAGEFADGSPYGLDRGRPMFEQGVKDLFGGDPTAVYRRYLELTRQMLAESRPDILGHLDKLKIYNTDERYFPFSAGWYLDELSETVEAIREAGVIVEVNTRGSYLGLTADFYPSRWVLERLVTSGIPVTLSADAHAPHEVCASFDAAAALLREVGFTSVRMLRGGVWSDCEL